MTIHPKFKPFNFEKWIEKNRDNLKPPVSNKQLFDEETGMIVMIVGDQTPGSIFTMTRLKSFSIS